MSAHAWALVIVLLPGLASIAWAILHYLMRRK
jgi:hypothetical protein